MPHFPMGEQKTKEKQEIRNGNFLIMRFFNYKVYSMWHVGACTYSPSTPEVEEVGCQEFKVTFSFTTNPSLGHMRPVSINK